MEGEKSTTKPVSQFILRIILVFISHLKIKILKTKISGLITLQKIIWACYPPSPNGEKGLRNLLELI